MPWATMARWAEQKGSPADTRRKVPSPLRCGVGQTSAAMPSTLGQRDQAVPGGRSFRKELAESSAEVAMAASQSSVMGREARVDFFLASSNRLMNSDTLGSSTHHRCIVINIETTLARSRPPLWAEKKSIRSRGATWV